MSLVGSLCGLFLLYIIPISVYLVIEYLEIHYPKLQVDILENKLDTIEGFSPL